MSRSPSGRRPAAPGYAIPTREPRPTPARARPAGVDAQAQPPGSRPCRPSGRTGHPLIEGRRLVSATRVGQGVVARFHDGSTETADLLIGADGVHSVVRGLIDPSAPRGRYVD